MAKNLYNLTAVTTVNDSDLLHVNQGSVSSDKKVTKQNLLKEVNSSISSINNSLTKFNNAVLLQSFTGTSSSSLALNDLASKYRLLCVRLYNTNNEVCGVATAPPNQFRNLYYKIFGESSSQWGQFALAGDYASATFNRTSANTSKIDVYGIMEIWRILSWINSLTNSLTVGEPIVKTDISLSSVGIQLFDWAELNPPPTLSGYTFVDYIFVSSTYRFCLLGRGGTRVYYYVGTSYANSGSVTAYPIYRKNA